MRRLFGLLLLLSGLLLAPANSVFAQSITVLPAAASVGIGKTRSFSAQVTGLPQNDVNWKAGGVVGGNTVAGTISTAGLYQAPAILPGQNPVQIVATSKVNTAISGTVYVTILLAGPTITVVSPNPLPPGTITVTITGSGLKPGAVAYVSYGNNIGIQMTTGTVTAASMTATGYLGSASSATFYVRNPGSDYSNSLTVPVSGGGGETGNHTLGVFNGTGSGSYAPGAVVAISANAPPAGQSFVNWTGAAVQNPTASATTLTMPAANTTVTANYTGSAIPPAPPVQLPPVPFPVSSHPRLWITQNSLPKLQGWAVAGNPIYQQGIVPLLQQAVNVYQTKFFPNGVANPNYPDPGDTQGYSGYLTEQYAVVLAFNSLIDPSAAHRIQYAQYARNMLMVAMNQAALGHLVGAPFRDPLFAVYNRANGSGEQWPLIVDWIYSAQDAQGHAILTPADKATIRTVFMMWANDCLNASTTGGDHPSPIGVTNSLQLLHNNKPYRMAANNYYLGHARLLTMMTLSIDQSDDPPLNGNLSAGQLGNTLRSYITDANGAWLFQEFAMFGDPATAANAYGIPGSGAGFGLASGGLPAEGMLYGHSIGYILGQLLALQTAGFHNAAYAGPQIQLIDAPVWDRFMTGYLTSLTPTAKVDPTQPYLGPVFEFGSYGDLLRLWVTPDVIQPFALLALLNQENNKTTNLDAARWVAVNALEGGPSALMSRITNPWSYSSSDSILYYLLLDPNLPAAADPRLSFPTMFTDPAAGRVVAHSDWGANGTMFDYRASWLSINHQNGDGGQFELYRKGEWLTKEMSNYDNNFLGQTTPYHNTLGLQNWSPNGMPTLFWFETGEWTNGSQWMLGQNAGDPTTVTSSGPGYVYATSDLTNLYNRPNFWQPAMGATDILQATRSILWLNNDYIVVYDRAASLHTGLFKRFNLCLTNPPTINGNVVTETLGSGQQLFVQTLLPAAPSITSTNTAKNLTQIAWLEPTRFTLTVEDPSKPANVRFLHVLQGADAGAAMVPAVGLKSSQGTAFDGAVFGSSAVYFPVNVGTPIAATTFTVPNSVNTLLVTGLTANASYGLTIQSGPTGTQIVVTPGGTGAVTDAAGVLQAAF